MSSDQDFLVEFERGAGVGGTKLIGHLAAYSPKKSKKARPTADFIFPGYNGLTYSFHLDDGHPKDAKLRGKLRVAEHERGDLLLRLDLFKGNVKCHFCKKPAFKRAKGEPPPRQVKHGTARDFRFVWCCPRCREPALPGVSR